MCDKCIELEKENIKLKDEIVLLKIYISNLEDEIDDLENL